MSHGAGKRHRGGGHEEEHENHERWAVSYADMMTVLMALFLVLFAMSSIDVKKFEELRTSLAKGFGNEALPTSGGAGIEDGSTGEPIAINSDASPVTIANNAASNGSHDDSIKPDNTSIVGPAAGTGAGDELAARTEASRLQKMQDEVNAALAAKGLTGTVVTSIDSRGLNINVVANDIFFQSASAVIQPRGYQVLDAIGPVLAGSGDDISVEGHTNNLKITSAQYPSNWELSAARAVSVLRHLSDADGVAGERLQAIGYGDTRPMYANDDPKAVEGNRRVDILVQPDASPQVMALIPSFVTGAQAAPAVAPSTTTEGTDH